MNKRKADRIDNISDLSDKLLADIDEIKIDFASSRDPLEQASADAFTRFQRLEEMGIAFPSHGYVTIQTDDDNLRAYADFYPASEGMKHITMDHLLVQLEIEGVNYGIHWAEIKEAMTECNLSGKPVKHILAAEGEGPVEMIPSHIVIEPDLKSPPKKEPDSRGPVDYREMSPFIFVKKGQVLGRRREERPGSEGMDISSQNLPFKVRKVRQLNPLKNIVEEDGLLRAACDGRFELTEDEFLVSETLVLAGGVDYQTGNINFAGDVIIKGDVKDNFVIKAGGSVLSESTLDASLVSCKGDVLVQQGIIGRRKGKVIAEGEIRSKFIENCYVEAGKAITVSTGILHSAVHSSDIVDCSGKGIIVGGCVYAQNGVKAYQIGSQMGPKTEIYCGLNFSAVHQLELIQDKSMKLALMLQKINSQIARSSGEQLEKLAEIKVKVQNAMSSLNNKAADLVVNLDKNDQASVEVSGQIYPGSYIEIGHVSYIVQRVFNRVRFVLNKEQGIIEVEKLVRKR
ncbi:DUF342 domain-containing protein [Spirochaeta dissipatitropha]